MNRKAFYSQLDELYKRRDPDDVERFLLDMQRELDHDRSHADTACDLRVISGSVSRRVIPETGGTSGSSRLKDLLTVQNELLSLYRSFGRFDECLTVSSVMKEEMRALGLLDSEDYAILLINEGTAYRMMMKWEEALHDFDECETILKKSPGTDPFTLASLYNNRSPVFRERGHRTQSRNDIQKALDDLQAALEILHATGGHLREEAITLCGIADAYALLGDNAAGEQAADQAILLYKEAGTDSHTGAAFNIKAQFLYKNKQYLQAAGLFRKAAAITRSYYGENSDYRICIANANEAEQRSRFQRPESQEPSP